MQNNTVETLIAAAVLAIAAGFLFFAYSSTHAGSISGYELQASLNSVDGIAAGGDVRIHGVKIGTISMIDMNPKTYKPIAQLSIRDDVRLPQDSSAQIASGILNSTPYLSIQPGHSAKMLAAGQSWKAN
jgi:phospholipid/cholesterol/gamma-HCH transport system substrate-binding protein